VILAVSHASTSYWGAKSPGGILVDAGAALWWWNHHSWPADLAAPVYGAAMSALYEGHNRPQKLAAPSLSELPGAALREDIVQDGEFYRVEGKISADGGELQVLDRDGKVLDTQVLDPGSAGVAAKECPGKIYIWVGGCWLVLIFDHGHILGWYLA
jgi:hypothetical protein